MPPKISVIIPVYNVAKYLEECLNSILSQTLKEIEVLCIDDGSTDNSLEILQTFKNNDNRISVISQENQGVSIARNAGLLQATGTYIYFMDSDDYLKDNNSFQILYHVLSTYKLDFLSFNYSTIGYETKQYQLSITSNVILNGKEYFQKNGRGNVMPWLRMFDHLYLKKIDFTFQPHIDAEDELSLPKLCYYAEKAMHITDSVLVYRLRANSLTHSKITLSRIHGLLASSQAYFELSDKEDQLLFKRRLNQWGLEFLFIAYRSISAVSQETEAKKIYHAFKEQCHFTSSEKKLLLFEERHIQNNRDIMTLLGRKIKRFYFKYLWK